MGGGRLQDTGEWALLRGIRAMFGARGRGVIRGIGDDAAILRLRPGADILVTTDMLVEGIHFTLSTITPYLLGRKALAVNLSDIAAMGGVPRAAFLSMALPPRLRRDILSGLLRGLRDMCRGHHVVLAGGDTSSSRSGMTLSLTVVGEARHPVGRGGARHGDWIFVTGTLGDSALGLEILRRRGAYRLAGLSRSARFLVRRHCDPDPRIPAGRTLSERSIATAMIDISDGILSDLGHLVEESGVGARIEAERLPLSPALLTEARLRGKDPVDFALTGGEDYELLFTAPPGTSFGTRGIAGLPVVRIGIMDMSLRRVHVTVRGRDIVPRVPGYEHFSGGRRPHGGR